MKLAQHRILWITLTLIVLLIAWRKLPLLAANRSNEAGLHQLQSDQSLARAMFAESSSHGYREQIPTYNLAGTFMAEKDYRSAHQYYEQVLHEDPDFVEALYNDGHALYDWGAQRNDPQLNNAAEVLKLWNTSIERFSDVVQLSPKDAPLAAKASENIKFVKSKITDLSAAVERTKPSVTESVEKPSPAKDDDRDQSRDLNPPLADDRDSSPASQQTASNQNQSQQNNQQGQSGQQNQNQSSGQNSQQASGQQNNQQNPPGQQNQNPANSQNNGGTGQNSQQTSGQPNNQQNQSGQQNQNPANSQNNGGNGQNSQQTSGQPNNQQTQSGQLNQNPANSQNNGGTGQTSQQTSGQPNNQQTQSGQQNQNPTNSQNNGGNGQTSQQTSGQPNNQQTQSGQQNQNPANSQNNGGTGQNSQQTSGQQNNQQNHSGQSDGDQSNGRNSTGNTGNGKTGDGSSLGADEQKQLDEARQRIAAGQGKSQYNQSHQQQSRPGESSGWVYR